MQAPLNPPPVTLTPPVASAIPANIPTISHPNYLIRLAGTYIIGGIIAWLSAHIWLMVFTELPYLMRIQPERIIHQQAVYSPQTFFLRILDNHPDLTKKSTAVLWFDGADTLRSLPLQKPMPWIGVLVIEDSPLESLPANINLFAGVRHVTIRNTRIRNLPAQIGDISSIETLYLEGNRISRLPESIGNLVNLTALNLAHNNLEDLPAGLQHLTKLTELDLSGNRLREFPRVLPPNLKVLYIGGNRIPASQLHKAKLPDGEDILY